MSLKDELHRLVDELPSGELRSAKRYLEYLRNMGDPALRKLLEAPEDDEPSTREEDESADQAWQDYLRGNWVSSEQAKRELLE